MLIQTCAPVFRSQNPIQSPCSFSPLPLSLSKNYSILRMKMEMEKEGIRCFNGSRYINIIRQTPAKTARKRTATRENPHGCTHQGKHGRACWVHDRAPPTIGRASLQWAARGGHCLARSDTSSTQHFGFLWTLIWVAEPSCIRPILQLCLIYMPQLHLAWIQLTLFS